MYNWPNKTILIAEDEDMNYFLLEEILYRTNVKIIWAENGQKAVQLYENNSQINLILMDLKMPEMNGFDATMKIKEKNKNVPIIAQTAYAFSYDRDTIIKSGFDEYITKPFKAEPLLKMISKFLEDNKFTA